MVDSLGIDDKLTPILGPRSKTIGCLPSQSKSMRMPARPLCQLTAVPYTPPMDDYSELSRFLRISTMPGYSSNDNISEYKGAHNMEVWDGQKGDATKHHNMKRDWLSVWGEFNVKEQRWRKAWVEKFGVDKA